MHHISGKKRPSVKAVSRARAHKERPLERIDNGQLTRQALNVSPIAEVISTYFPTKFSNTDDFPADWPPTTAIWGRSMTMVTPSCVKASCMRLMIGIRASMPRFPAFAAMLTQDRSTGDWNFWPRDLYGRQKFVGIGQEVFETATVKCTTALHSHSSFCLLLLLSCFRLCFNAKSRALWINTIKYRRTFAENAKTRKVPKVPLATF